MVDASGQDITGLLLRWNEGDNEAQESLMSLVYGELRRLAAHYLRVERRDHTLQPTALVHEAYLRLVDQSRVTWQSRAHFFGIAAQTMRRILVEHARRRNAAKRGGAAFRVSTGIEESVASPAPDPEILALDEALTRLESLDTGQARVAEGWMKIVGAVYEIETGRVKWLSP